MNISFEIEPQKRCRNFFSVLEKKSSIDLCICLKMINFNYSSETFEVYKSELLNFFLFSI